MLQETTIKIPLVNGIDTKTDSRVAPIGELVALENGTFQTPGRIRKRNGGANLLTGIAGTAKAVIPWQSSLVAVDGNNHLQLKVGSALVDKGEIPKATARPMPVARNASVAQLAPDGAYGQGNECFVWEENNSIRYRVIDSATGVQLADGTIGTGKCLAPRIASQGPGGIAYVWRIFYWRHDVTAGTARVHWVTMNCATFEMSADATLGNDISLDKQAAQLGVLDVYQTSNFLSVCIPVAQSTPGGLIGPGLYVIDTNGGTTYKSLAGSLTISDMTCVAHCYDSNALVFFIDEHDYWRFMAYRWATDAVIANTWTAIVPNVRHVACASTIYTRPDLTQVSRTQILYSVEPQDPRDSEIRALILEGSAAYTTYTKPEGGHRSFLAGASLASGMAQSASGQWLTVATFQSVEQATYFVATVNDSLLSTAEDQIAARCLSGIAGGTPARATLPQVYTRGAAGSAVAVLEKTSLGSTPKDGLFALTSVDSLRLGSGTRVSSAVLADVLHVAAGDLLMLFDGDSLTEEGFHIWPEGIRVPVLGGTTHVYQYSAVYSWQDHTGRVHRSANSTPISWSHSDPISGTNTVSVQVPSLLLTRKAGVQVELYRTKDKETTFYRVGAKPNGVGWITFVDSLTDSDLEGVQASGGNIGTPSGMILAAGRSAAPAPAVTPSWGYYLGESESAGGFHHWGDVWIAVCPVTAYGEKDPAWVKLDAEIGGTTNYMASVNVAVYVAYPDVERFRVYSSIEVTHADAKCWGEFANRTGSGIDPLVLTLITPLADLDPLYNAKPPASDQTSSGTLAAGTYYYRVAAYNDIGTTLPCAEDFIALGGVAGIDVNWSRVPGAKGYKVYGRATGAELLLATVPGEDSIWWHDDGSVTPAGALPVANTTGVTRIPGAIQLYTSSGYLENLPPPAVAWLAVGRNRLFCADAENPSRVCFTHEVLPGQPCEWNPTELSINCDPTGGSIVGVQPMDEKVILLKGSSLYAFAGQGPDRSGNGSDYGQPQLIAGDCGILEPGSAVLMPSGIMFQSAKGVMLLDRGLNLGYIGAPVEQWNSETINSSVLVATQNQVRMASTSRVLVYDYHAQKWSTFEIAGIRSSCMFGGLWTYLLSTSVVRETPGVFVDPGSAAIRLKVKTAWMNFAGIAGFARARRMLLLGSYLSAHNLRVKLYVTPSDNSAVAVQDETFTANAGELHRIPLTQQKFSALQVEIWDDFTGLTPGEGYDLSALAFEVGLKGKLAKLSSAKTY